MPKLWVKSLESQVQALWEAATACLSRCDLSRDVPNQAFDVGKIADLDPVCLIGARIVCVSLGAVGNEPWTTLVVRYEPALA
ncbi:MAG TPA: hypothetical protein DDZ51_25565 [Planctomycetaceae bacterium]|nr:hypothetical protein [Planctomycetaceae bacterium]